MGKHTQSFLIIMLIANIFAFGWMGCNQTASQSCGQGELSLTIEDTSLKLCADSIVPATQTKSALFKAQDILPLHLYFSNTNDQSDSSKAASLEEQVENPLMKEFIQSLKKEANVLIIVNGNQPGEFTSNQTFGSIISEDKVVNHLPTNTFTQLEVAIAQFGEKGQPIVGSLEGKFNSIQKDFPINITGDFRVTSAGVSEQSKKIVQK